MAIGVPANGSCPDRPRMQKAPNSRVDVWGKGVLAKFEKGDSMIRVRDVEAPESGYP